MSNKSEALRFRLTSEEKEALKNLIEKEYPDYKNYSVFLRKVFRELINQKPDYNSLELEEFRKMRNALNSVGRNLNQIAKRTSYNGESNSFTNPVYTAISAQLTTINELINSEIERTSKRLVITDTQNN